MQAGVTVYLEGTPELLAERVLAQDGAASRPLLAGANGGEPSLEVAAEKIQGLLNDRQASYKNADCIVQLAGQGSLGASVPEVCRMDSHQNTIPLSFIFFFAPAVGPEPQLPAYIPV